MSNIGDMLVDVKGLKSVHDSIKNTFSTKQELTNVDNKFSEVNSARQSGNGTTYDNLKARLDADKEAAEKDIGKLKANLDDNVNALNSLFNGDGITFGVPTANQTYTFSILFTAGFTYTITNNTSASCTMNVRDVDGGNTSLSTNLLAGKSVDFTPPNNNYVAIRGWMTGTGTIRVTVLGVNTLISENTNGIRANKANVIFTRIGRTDINVVNKTISWGGSMYLDTSGERYTVSASDAYTQLSNYAVYDAENNKITITMPQESVLVYRVSDAVLKVVSRRNVAIDDVVLFSEYYENDYGVLWDKYWRDHYIDNYANNNCISANDIFNAEPYEGTYDWQTPVVNYGKLFKGKANIEAFAFFTDSHVLGFADSNRNEKKMANYLKRVQKVYNTTPCSFIVNGGDWLNNSTTMDEACYRLGYLKGIATHLLDGCKLVIGNHDTNYQGKETASSDNYTGTLTNETIASILFRDTDTKKAYYSFDGSNSKCYVLDTGIEHSTMLTYDWDQVDWLADKLATDDAEHAIIFMHIIMQGGAVQTNASNFGTLVEAYNNHATVTLNSKTYDFTGCTGHVDFWVAGHTHQDSTGTLGGIPYFITATNSYNSDVPLIDLALVDYDNRTVNLVRVGGTGLDRTISIA